LEFHHIKIEGKKIPKLCINSNLLKCQFVFPNWLSELIKLIIAPKLTKLTIVLKQWRDKLNHCIQQNYEDKEIILGIRRYNHPNDWVEMISHCLLSTLEPLNSRIKRLKGIP